MKKCLICHTPWNEELSLFNYFASVNLLCPVCEKQLTLRDVRRCTHCRKVLTEDEIDCLDCEFIGRFFTPVDAIDCLYDYNDFMKLLISQYKFRKDVQLSEVFASMLNRQRIRGTIIAIPTSKEKLKQRGFDHMRMIIEESRYRYCDILQMNARNKQAQLSKIERLNEGNPFYVAGSVPPAVTLIDDIYTTGLTVHRAAEVLRQNGCRKIKVLTFARA